MFVQVIQGRIRDAVAARRTMDRWLEDVQPGAVGWLGGTFGVTDDGVLCAIVRFDSREAAAENSARPEQAAWWEEMQGHFDGPVTFHDCDDVQLLVGGGSDEAGFVQIMQGKVSDRTAVHGLMDRAGELIAEHRKDVLGATIAIDDDGWFTETVFFTNEADARQGEGQQMPAAVQELVDEESRLVSELRFMDLHTPWFATARRTS
jgi:hypothetical protein